MAIVGASGAGKSTLLKLLCGFEEVDEGDYYLCGQVFSKWDINEARRLISYVPQDSFLFPETILENLAYGAKNIDIEKVENACKKQAYIRKFVSCQMDLTQKLENGVRIFREGNDRGFLLQEQYIKIVR